MLSFQDPSVMLSRDSVPFLGLLVSVKGRQMIPQNECGQESSRVSASARRAASQGMGRVIVRARYCDHLKILQP